MSASENQIVVYQPNETVRLDVRLENETVWLTQSQMEGARKVRRNVTCYSGRGVRIELTDLRSQNITSKVDVKEAA